MANITKKEIIDSIDYAYEKYCIYEKSMYLERDINRNFNSLIQTYGVVEALYLNKDSYLLHLLKKKCNYSDLMHLIYEFCKETNIKSIKIYRDCGVLYEDAINKYNYKETVVLEIENGSEWDGYLESYDEKFDSWNIVFEQPCYSLDDLAKTINDKYHMN